MALAYLPEEMIENAFKFLVDDCHREHGAYFDQFIKYYEAEWIKIVTPKGFSIYRKEFSTNNFLETYHRLITQLMRKKPRPVNFLSKSWDN